MSKKPLKFVGAVVLSLIVAGCSGTWSTSSVEPVGGVKAGQDPVDASVEIVTAPATDPAKVYITEKDITDRKYRIIADIEVQVNKTTIFHDDPTRGAVNAKLKKEAAEMGADAVIFVRYGSPGISAFSWGSLEGRGRAIAYVN